MSRDAINRFFTRAFWVSVAATTLVALSPIVVLATISPGDATAAGEDHVEIGVMCRGNVPLFIRVVMEGKGGKVDIPVLAVFRYCEHEAGQGKPL